MALFFLENRDFWSFRMIFNVWLNAVYHNIQDQIDYGVFHIYRSWVIALFLLEIGTFRFPNDI